MPQPGLDFTGFSFTIAKMFIRLLLSLTPCSSDR